MNYWFSKLASKASWNIPGRFVAADPEGQIVTPSVSKTEILTSISLSIFFAFSVARAVGATPVTATEELAFSAGQQAYIYGLPLVIAAVTREVATAVPAPVAGKGAPINQFGHTWTFPTHETRLVVSPNADTLYTAAFLDLSPEPIVLHVPDTQGRYYVMQLTDAWTNVFAVRGKRTTGTAARDFAIVGPNWKGTLPEGLERIDAPTNMVGILGRTQTSGERHTPAVTSIQERSTLTPLSPFGTSSPPPAEVSYDPHVDTATPPAEQVL